MMLKSWAIFCCPLQKRISTFFFSNKEENILYDLNKPQKPIQEKCFTSEVMFFFFPIELLMRSFNVPELSFFSLFL